MTIWKEKVEIYWRLQILCLKQKRRTFFSKVKNRCLDMKKWKTVIMRWKPMLWRYFQCIIMISFKNYVKNFFPKHFFTFCEKSRNLLRDFEPKYMIFFKKLKSMFKCLKNSIRQMKPTSYRYFWTRFHYGISGFEYRNPSQIRCREISEIWVSLKKMPWS